MATFLHWLENRIPYDIHRTVDFDGCSLGRLRRVILLKNQRREVTTSNTLVAKLSPCVCCKTHHHDICQGAATYQTGFYTGWKLDVLVKFIERFRFLTVDFDGCSLGLKSKKGNPIKKPWRVVTTSFRN